jgi:hypothetical protein
LILRKLFLFWIKTYSNKKALAGQMSNPPSGWRIPRAKAEFLKPIYLIAFLKELMKSTVPFILQVLIILTLPQAALAETEWELIEDSEGVVVYARELEGYPERQFKGICLQEKKLFA